MKRKYLVKTFLMIVPALLFLMPGGHASAEPIIIDGCSSGVENQELDSGITMSDLIADCAESATNHGEFVSCVAHLTNTWKKDGLIEGREKGAIQRCAAAVNIPPGCTADSDCEDGAFCNGEETCIDRVCQPGTPVTCADDGMFCNGSELCDETADACVNSGNPCAPGTECNEDTDICGCVSDAECDDGLFCTGQETCVGGACQPGTPVACADDGMFCNGSEFCDETADSCVGSDAPCGQLMICNEDDDTCESQYTSAFKRLLLQLQQGN